jgi:hypothetical protein
MDVPKNMQRWPNPPYRGQQVRTPMIAVAALCNVENPEWRTVGYH